jgi:hypothetical protein
VRILLLMCALSAVAFGVAPSTVASGNKVGPLSNGPALTMTAKKVALVGKWQGINGTPGRLVLRANHTYSYSVGGGGGRWSAVTGGAVFTGTLSSWNHGRASTKRGVLEFSWTRADGAKSWFVFAKVG